MSFKLTANGIEETPEIRSWLDEVSLKLIPIVSHFSKSPEYAEFLASKSLDLAKHGTSSYTPRELEIVIEKYNKRIGKC